MTTLEKMTTTTTTTTGTKNYTIQNYTSDKQSNLKMLNSCGDHLKQGELVAFPTETVYGLGANALNETAVRKIFAAKGRPLTDPVIVHVLNWEDATKKHKLVDVSDNEKIVIKHLAKHFWPGPLTMVVKSDKNIVPDCITASTGYVGIRAPSHPIARQLIETSGLPISAPSANRFGHISPTKAQHVVEDLGYTKYPLMIIESKDPDHKCQVGIESSVLKVSEENGKIQLTLFRRGGTSEEKLREAIKRVQKENPSLNIDLFVATKTVKNETSKGQQAPGQMITHYAPDVPTYMFNPDNSMYTKECNGKFALKDCILIDFNRRFFGDFESICKKYILLSKTNDMSDVARHLFKVLREAEKEVDASCIVVPNLSSIDKEFAKACHDRLYRSASGKECQILSNHVILME